MPVNRMDIAHLDPPAAEHQGDHIYRTVHPCRALGELAQVRVLNGCWLTPAMREACMAADVLVINKAVDFDLLPLVHARRAAGLPTFYEINDDFAALEESHPTRAFFAAVEHRSLLTQLARLSSGVQFSSTGLLRAYGDLHLHHRVFENHFYDLPKPRPRPQGPRITVGWGGSAGHLPDIAQLVPTLRALLNRYPQLDLAVMGSDPIRALFQGLPAQRCRLYPTGSLDDYLAFLHVLDIGLAPLRTTAFNLGRSDIKFVEYAFCGVAALCADIGPYRESVQDGVTGLLVGELEDWYAAIARLVETETWRRALTQRARAWAVQARRERDHAKARMDFYQCSNTAPPSADRRRGFDRVCKEALRPYAESHYYHLPLGNAEKHLYNALLQQADKQQALQDLTHAGRLAPDNYLVPLYRANRSDDFEAELVRARELAPTAPSIPFCLARRRMASGDLQAMGDALAATLACAPDHAPARTMLSQLQLTWGQDDAAHTGLRRALQDNPDYYPAALSLASWLAQRKQVTSALEVLKGVEASAAREPRYWLELGKLHLLQGQRDAAIVALRRNAELAPDGPARALLRRLDAEPRAAGRTHR